MPGRELTVVRVKICGITCAEDALAAVAFGADALGFVFAPSPRRVTPQEARAIIRRLPPLVATVGVFVNESTGAIKEIQSLCGLDMIQLHGDESEADAARLGTGVIKALRVGNGPLPRDDSYPTATLLLDTYSPGARGGTAQTFDWRVAAGPAGKRPIILAGGLTPDNVAQAVETVRPYAVDVSSGVEHEPRRKDYEKLACFIRRAKAVEQPA
jgi:phosphoribosylanthranilate isomerase